MDIFNNFINILSDSDAMSLGTQSDATAIDESISSQKQEVLVPVKFRADYDTLKGLYPDVFNETQGEIVLSLTDALVLLPRDRSRTDAYHALQEWLMNIGITLTIISRKGKKK